MYIGGRITKLKATSDVSDADGLSIQFTERILFLIYHPCLAGDGRDGFEIKASPRILVW